MTDSDERYGRRALMGRPPREGLGPRAISHRARRPAKNTVGATGGSPAGGSPVGTPADGALTEWHEMTPGQRVTAWADLRAWVTWLTDRYELTIEDRLPRCWARHPGLVEELWALRVWRSEIYGSGLRPAGQAARYWHAELDRVLHAATSRYATGCRAGHRGAKDSASEDQKLRESWATISPVARVPDADLDAAAAKSLGGWMSVKEMSDAIDSGQAAVLPGARDYVLYQDGWWLPVSGGWVRDPSRPAGEPEEEGEP